jgi:hypothetical protein
MRRDPNPVKVGRVDCSGPVVGFPTIAAAEDYVATTLADADPEGVERGDYYVDPPEELANRLDGGRVPA